MFPMWVFCAARPHNRKVSVSSRPATWFLSLPSMMARPPLNVELVLVRTLMGPEFNLTIVSGQDSSE
jgi:hypothetical protein